MNRRQPRRFLFSELANDRFQPLTVIQIASTVDRRDFRNATKVIDTLYVTFSNESNVAIKLYNVNASRCMSDIVAPYSKPPITEAVIGVNFESEISSDDVISISKKYLKYYSNVQTVKHLNVKIDGALGFASKPVTNYHEIIGQRLSSNDMTQLLVIWPSSFSLSQLAPYTGWENFYDRFVRDWKVWKHKYKHKTISRIGVRYINRIDIPAPGPQVEHEDYLNIYPKLPENFTNVDGYSVNIVTKLHDIGCQLRINSAVVPSPILNHMAFVIDQDIGTITPPQNDKDIYALLNAIRKEKNKVFESCITDKARELFQK